MKSKFYEKRPSKPKLWADEFRAEHGIRLIQGVPLRIHTVNGCYMFSVYVDNQNKVYTYTDKRWVGHRSTHETKAVKIN